MAHLVGLVDLAVHREGDEPEDLLVLRRHRDVRDDPLTEVEAPADEAETVLFGIDRGTVDLFAVADPDGIEDLALGDEGDGQPDLFKLRFDLGIVVDRGLEIEVPAGERISLDRRRLRRDARGLAVFDRLC